MSLRKVFRRSHLWSGFEQEWRRIPRLLLRVKSRYGFAKYISEHAIRKLQIGAGPSKTEGWLLTDIVTKLHYRTLFLDATRKFPVPASCFDYIFSEHMIEHVSHEDAKRMLGECYRVLKPGGKIRIATPDLNVLLSLTRAERGNPASRYIAWVTKMFLPRGTPSNPVFVINNAFRNWGHQFLYDEELLCKTLASAGFQYPKRVKLGQSEDPHFQGLESHGRNMDDEEMIAFETMVIEAVRQA
jgi:predicted SAM-dependent methyltransferase